MIPFVGELCSLLGGPMEEDRGSWLLYLQNKSRSTSSTKNKIFVIWYDTDYFFAKFYQCQYWYILHTFLVDCFGFGLIYKKRILLVCLISNLQSHVFIILSSLCSRFNVYAKHLFSYEKNQHYISGDKEKHAQKQSIFHYLLKNWLLILIWVWHPCSKRCGCNTFFETNLSN